MAEGKGGESGARISFRVRYAIFHGSLQFIPLRDFNEKTTAAQLITPGKVHFNLAEKTEDIKRHRQPRGRAVGPMPPGSSVGVNDIMYMRITDGGRGRIRQTTIHSI